MLKRGDKVRYVCLDTRHGLVDNKLQLNRVYIIQEIYDNRLLTTTAFPAWNYYVSCFELISKKKQKIKLP